MMEGFLMEARMFVKNISHIEKKRISGEGMKNVLKQVPIGPEQGWKDHVLRVFTVEPGGHTPLHSHDWEHVNYVISGNGVLEIEGQKQALESGHFALVPPAVKHRYVNEAGEDFVMICIVPAHGDY
jgi:quercetin dioxygenase-like cupin family protein